MANRLSSVQRLLLVMRPTSVPLWCEKTRGRKRAFNLVVTVYGQFNSKFVDRGEPIHRFSTSLRYSFSVFNFSSTFLHVFHSAFTIQPTRCHSSFTWHFPSMSTPKNIDSHRNTLLCVFECAARHLSTLCSHLAPLGPNMIMVVVNLFAEEAFAAKGA